MPGGKMTITVRYSSVDGFHQTRRFEQLSAARRHAQKWIGEFPEVGSDYAISDDGVGKITVEGATLNDLFPQRN
jgi:hypothetical protein